MANIVGEGFNPVIVSQIKQRQIVYGSINRTEEQLSFLQARTGWCKLVSSVDVSSPVRGIPYTGTELASRFVLFNGTTNESPTRGDEETYQRGGIWQGSGNFNNYAYGMGGTAFGLNPMPGITQATIKTETRGSLKTATINIKANNRNQFDIIDILYLRLGYSMLLEWGNSSYYDNNGTYIADNPHSLADDFLTGKIKYNNYYSKISSKINSSCGNYDAVIGKVVNFNWTFTKEGTYDITLTLRSLGDVIESLKTNALLPGGTSANTTSTSGTAGSSGTAGTSGTAAGPPPEPTPEEVIKSFANVHDVGKKFYNLQQKLQPLGATGAGISKLTGDTPGDIVAFRQQYEGNSAQYYIRLGYFLEFIQNTILPKVDTADVPIQKIDTDVESNIIYLMARQISTDPGVCIFNKVFNTPSGFVEFAAGTNDFVVSAPNGKNQYGKIMNAYFNMQYILTQMNSLKNEDGKVSLYDLLNSLCIGWNNATGNFNKLEPTIDVDENIIRFTDEVVLPDRDSWLGKQEKSTVLASFDVYGYYYGQGKIFDETTKKLISDDGWEKGQSHAGFIRDISFNTTISPNLATMITVGATSNGYVVGQDSTALSRMNAGLNDRFKKTIFNPTDSKTEGSGSINENYKSALEAFQVFLRDLGSWKGTTKPKWNQESITNFTNTAVTFYEYDQAKQSLQAAGLTSDEASAAAQKNDFSALAVKPSSPNIGFLPFDLQLTMDGLSGMKVYQKYTADSSFLPSNYPTSLEFLIKGITNTVQNNEWTTTLESIAVPKNPFGSSISEGTVAAGSERDASRGTTPTPKTGITWNNLTQNQKSNAIYLYDTLLSYGFTDIEARAVLGIVSKESGFQPKNEYGYGGTKYSRLTSIWPWLGGKNYYPPNKASELEALAKDNNKFYDLVYGVGKKNPKGLYGNTSPGDGYKYRGRGFNQLTFKSSYEKYNKAYADQGSKAGKVDIVTNPDLLNKAEGGIYKIAAHFTALFFLASKNSLPKPQTQDTANRTYMRFNAGIGTSTSGNIFQEGLGKVNFFVNNLPNKIA